MLAFLADLSSRHHGASLAAAAAVLVAAIAACSLALPASGDSPDPAKGTPLTPTAPTAASAPGVPVLTSYRALPARLCVPVRAQDWAALRGGTARLVLHVQNQIPFYVYSPTFTVTLIDPATAKPTTVDHFSTQPDNRPQGQASPAAGALPEPQHFAIDLGGHLPATLAGPSLCLQVDIERGPDATKLAATQPEGHPLRLWATVEPR